MELFQTNPRPLGTRLINRRNGWGDLKEEQKKRLLAPVNSFNIVPLCRPKSIRIASRMQIQSSVSSNSSRNRPQLATTEEKKEVIKKKIFHISRAQSQRVSERNCSSAKKSLCLPTPSIGPTLSAKAWVTSNHVRQSTIVHPTRFCLACKPRNREKSPL